MSEFSITTAGESHGPMLTVIVRGMPAGVELDRERMDREMARRQRGYGRGGRMKIESDSIELTAGVRGGETLGSPVSMIVRNRDFENWKAAMDPWETDPEESEKRRLKSPRPGHADLVGGIKYGRHDLRDVLERASARETAARVAAGSLARELLRNFDIEVRSGVVALGSIGDPAQEVSFEQLVAIDDESPLRAVTASLESAMIEEIDLAKLDGNTLGGVVVVAARGVPVGLGSYVHWDEKLDGRIAQAITSVHAVKAVSIGAGVEAAVKRGSEVHDPIVYREKEFSRTSNRAGGLEGGVTTGEDLVVRAYMKPISTLRRGLPSVDMDTKAPYRSQWERSDVTALPACGVVCEAMLAIVIADAMRRKFGGDSLSEMKANYDNYLENASKV